MIGSILEAGIAILDKLIPDPIARQAAKVRLLELEQQGKLAALNAELQLAQGQLEVNKIEAASPDRFVSGWRPAVGWVCAGGFAYTVLLQPLLPWLFGGGPLPDIPTEVLMTLLLGMLGLGGLRTAEKIKGAA
jgi:hypothetical protein